MRLCAMYCITKLNIFAPSNCASDPDTQPNVTHVCPSRQQIHSCATLPLLALSHRQVWKETPTNFETCEDTHFHRVACSVQHFTHSIACQRCQGNTSPQRGCKGCSSQYSKYLYSIHHFCVQYMHAWTAWSLQSREVRSIELVFRVHLRESETHACLQTMIGAPSTMRPLCPNAMALLVIVTSAVGATQHSEA